MNKILLETRNLKKSFLHSNGSITLFENLNLKINQGDLVALVGPSGSGKSSLLHLLALLDDPTDGKIVFEKQEIKSFSISQKDELRRKSISIIFQDNNLLTDFTALENIMMPLIIKGEKTKIISEKALKILKDVKISNRSNHFPNELSGGEQQRVAIARSLVVNPDIILADEMTGNLDEDTANNIFNFFINYIEQNNKTLVYVTHNKTYSLLADEIYYFKNKKIHLTNE